MGVRLIIGDVRAVLATIPDGSIDLVVTSPPFLALRSYLPADHPEKELEIGSEATPAEFLDALLALTAEWRRVLAPHGSIAVELGDTYAGSGGGGGDYAADGLRAGQPKFDGSARRYRGNERSAVHDRRGVAGWPLAKSLCFTPELYGIALAYGINPLTGAESPAGRWRVRNKVAWCRPNPPVGALGDKFRPATSYITVACTARDRWFDLEELRGEPSPNTHARTAAGVEQVERSGKSGDRDGNWSSLPELARTAGAPPLDWWEIPTQPYKGAHYACVSADTEALTPLGWRTQAELRDGDIIAAYNPGAESWGFERAIFHRYPFDGEMVSIEKRVTSQLLTPNHRVLYRTRKNETPRVREAGTLTAGCHLPVAAPMESGGVGPGEKAAALAGWFCTEGAVVAGWPVIYQSDSANPAKVQEIRSLLDGIGATYTEGRYERFNFGKPGVMVTFTVRGALAEWLRQFHKHIPTSAVFGWSDIDARALFDAMVDGDGHRRADGRMSFIQKSKPVAEAFQMLATRLGYRANLTPRSVDMWTVYVSPARWIDLRAGENGLMPAANRQHYTGTVWCPSVPSTFWLARRNGKVFITGNTFPEELPRRLILAMCPREVCVACGKPRRRVVEQRYALDETRPQARRALQLAREAGLTDAHLAAVRAVGISDAGKALVTQSGAGKNSDATQRLANEAKAVLGGYFREFTFNAPTTLGWTDCGCGAGWRPGVVLDPFAGSGTTLAVAQGLGRDAVGIDLDERNEHLCRERVGMFLTVEHLAVEA